MKLSFGEWCFVLAIAFLLWLVSCFRLRWIIRQM